MVTRAPGSERKFLSGRSLHIPQERLGNGLLPSTSAEALSGLARAFIYAGARALLASHWEVYSDATVKLITTALREMARDP